MLRRVFKKTLPLLVAATLLIPTAVALAADIDLEDPTHLTDGFHDVVLDPDDPIGLGILSGYTVNMVAAETAPGSGVYEWVVSPPGGGETWIDVYDPVNTLRGKDPNVRIWYIDTDAIVTITDDVEVAEFIGIGGLELRGNSPGVPAGTPVTLTVNEYLGAYDYLILTDGLHVFALNIFDDFTCGAVYVPFGDIIITNALLSIPVSDVAKLFMNQVWVDTGPTSGMIVDTWDGKVIINGQLYEHDDLSALLAAYPDLRVVGAVDFATLGEFRDPPPVSSTVQTTACAVLPANTEITLTSVVGTWNGGSAPEVFSYPEDIIVIVGATNEDGTINIQFSIRNADGSVSVINGHVPKGTVLKFLDLDTLAPLGPETWERIKVIS